MRIIIKVLIFGLLFLLLSNCEKKSTKQKQPPSTPTPKCLVTPVTLDFGSVQCQGTHTKSFKIFNTGQVTFKGTLTARDERPVGWNYFFIISGKIYTLNPGDSLIVDVLFDSKVPFVMDGWIETGHDVCEDVYCIGKGYF